MSSIRVACAGGLALVLMAGGTGTPVAARTRSASIIVSLLERPIGRETSEVRTTADGVTLESRMDLVERGGPLALTTTAAFAPDLTPRRYRSSGQTYRFVNVDLDVEVTGRSARVHHLGADATVALPDAFFAAQTWAPPSSRALLVKYWEAHGRPTTLAVLPGRPVRDVAIAYRGDDTVRAGGRDVRLRRYTVDGAVWGRESVWVDGDGAFAAMTSRIHIMALEAVREDLREALPALLAADVRDRMADLAALGAAVVPIARDAYALVGARVIDGTGAAPIEDAVLVVRDGRIAAVGARGTTPVPAGLRTVDARGATIVPGLWDMHAHASQIEWAGAYLGAGVTAARDMGGEFGFLTAFRDALATDATVGPRLFLAGLVDGDSDRALGAIVASTPEAGRAVVDRYHAAGFDQMKLYSLLQPPVVQAIVRRAHEMGMTVTGHVPTALGLAGAIDAGMDHIAHLPGGARDLVDRLAARHVVIDPTMPWGELLGHAPETPIASFEPGIDLIPEALRENYLSVTNRTDAATFAGRQRQSGALVKALFDAGVPIVVGTDAAVPGFSVLRNLEQLVDAGFTPMQALQAATIVPARAMRVDAEMGTIAAGKRADLLVLDANPLDDISNVRRSRWVASRGRLYRIADVRRSVGFGVPAAGAASGAASGQPPK
ncbi:MAG: amidohydrolase family protein [Vicinamibacterales bacterium]